MEAFLTTTVEHLRSKQYGDLTIVLGNESCDLDSAASALVYAAFLNWQHMQIKCKVCTRLNRDETLYKDDIFVPILNVDRNDFELKTEVAFCLKEYGIDTSKLVFRDDYDFQQLVTKPKTSVTLVDHHVLAKKDEFFSTLVTEIIDHRPVDKSIWKYNEDTRSSIELVGSCCSLVAQRIRSLSTLLAKEADFFNAHPTASNLLLCGIILDTVNFSREVNKATPVDEEVASFLESVLKLRNVAEERKTKLEVLVAARKNVSGLSAAQLLRKDVKIAGDILVPSFPILVEEFLKKPEALSSVAEALRLQQCAVALLLGMSLSNTLQRDAAVYSPNSQDIVEQFSQFLQDWKAPVLQLVQENLPNSKPCVYFKQINLSASRKQYMPALVKFQEMISNK